MPREEPARIECTRPIGDPCQGDTHRTAGCGGDPARLRVQALRERPPQNGDRGFRPHDRLRLRRSLSPHLRNCSRGCRPRTEWFDFLHLWGLGGTTQRDRQSPDSMARKLEGERHTPVHRATPLLSGDLVCRTESTSNFEPDCGRRENGRLAAR